MMGLTPASEKNLDGYGFPPIAWERVIERLDKGLSQAPETGGPNRHTTWLATVNPNGKPHVMPVGLLWEEGIFYFNAGPNTRKVKNLVLNPSCVITVATHEFDLVVEGEAARVSDETRLQHIASLFTEGGWSPTVQDGALYAEFSAPSAGPPPWYVYEVKPTKIYALGTAEPYGATRWTF